MSLRILKVFALVLVFAGAASTVSADPIDAYLVHQMSLQHVPGLSVAIIDHGKTVKLRSYGKANLELDAPMTPDSVIEIGSITKSFTAAAILLLVQDHKLSLDDPISRYLPEAPSEWQGITIRQLLNHTSGLSQEGIATNAKTALADFSEPEFFASATRMPLQSPPGIAFAYSNLGYDLLSIIVSRGSGQSYGDFLQARIFAPAGMTATRLIDRTAVVPGRAQGYLWTRGALHVCLPYSPTRFRGSASLESTLRDLVKWDAALNGDSLLSHDSRDQMWTSGVLKDGKPAGYGFGWEISLINGHPLVTHDGALNGFLTSVQRYTDDKVTVIVAINQSDLAESRGIASGVARIYLPALRPKVRVKPPVFAAPKPAAAAAASGYYEYWGNYMLVLSPTADGLSARLGGGGPAEYRATADGRYWQEEEATALTPVTDSSGAVTGMAVQAADGSRRVIPRLAPDFSGSKPAADTDPARTSAIKTALTAMEDGSAAVQASSVIAPGRKRDFSGSRDFGGLRSLQLVHDENVDGRGVTRHGDTISHVLAYHVIGDLHDADVLVFLTRDNLVADIDMSTE